MRTRRLGPYAVGAVALGGARWSLAVEPDEVAAAATLRAALDVGVTLIDTARAYTYPGHPAHNEWLIARLAGDAIRAGDVIVSTKGGHGRRADGAFYVDARPATLREHCDASLATFGLERLPLYSLHWPDPAVPLAESVGTLRDLRDEGKIELVGVCNVDAAELEIARGVTSIAAVQNRLSVIDRRGLAGTCADAGIAFLAYSPFGGTAGAPTLPAIEAVRRLAAARGTTPYQIAIAWLLALPAVIPLVGAGRPSSIRDAAAGAAIDLTSAELDEIGCSPT